MTTHRLPGLVLTDHTYTVPLDHGRPSDETLEVFAREVVATENEQRELPWMVFLQGGPGFASPRPVSRTSWISRAVRDHRLLLLDQRGTGRSTPVSAARLRGLETSEAQAEHLRHYRADSIVRDAELIRRQLLGDSGRWIVLGQSYGGFCTTHYLSSAPEGLAGAIITGGLPGLNASAEDVYRHTYPIVARKNQRYYARYPEDEQRVERIVRRLAEGDVQLPGGDALTPRRFQLLGLVLGMTGGLEELHYLVEDAFVPGSGELAYPFLRGVENTLAYDTNPIFSLLHEACYAQGQATEWAAQRLRPEYPEFEPLTGQGPLHFTGEMIYPWFFDAIGALAPLKGAAELLAADTRWPRLYDAERLASNDVPVAAAIYYEDMYVPRALSEQTAETIGNLRSWITSEHEHNGLRFAGEDVLDHLLELLRS